MNLPKQTAQEQIKLQRIDIKTREALASIDRTNAQAALTQLNKDIKRLNIQKNELERPFYTASKPIPTDVQIQIDIIERELADLENDRSKQNTKITNATNERAQCTIDNLKLDKKVIFIKRQAKAARKAESAVGHD